MIDDRRQARGAEACEGGKERASLGILVDEGRCNGCHGLEEALCVRACPGDLMAVDSPREKAYIRAQRDCWDCMCCVKACPRRALTTRLPFLLADHGASLVPEVGPDRIRWRLTDAKGRSEVFDIPTRQV